MVGQGTKHRPIRIPNDAWEDFGENTAKMGTDRSKTINTFIRWFNGEPDAELPERPSHGGTT